MEPFIYLRFFFFSLQSCAFLFSKIHRFYFFFKSHLSPTADSERTLETRLSGASWFILFSQALELLAECGILWAWASIRL